jgi:cell shape-determining protein MreC
MLMIDPQSRLDAYVERTRARGTVRGAASPTCDFDYVLRQEGIEEGDLLLTSGMGGVYPKGLRVGRIEKVDRKTSGLFLGAKVAPAVDFSRLDEVFVILEQRQIPEEQAFSAVDEGLWPEPPIQGPALESAPPEPPGPEPPLAAEAPPAAVAPR